MTLIGNKATVDDFRRDISVGRLSHAFIIEGAEGSGKTVLARTLASMLMCNADNIPCGACKGCITTLAGEHPDVKEIDVPEDKSFIPIDSIRELIKDAYVKPSEAGYTVFIIENAHKMTVPSQNALLQIFEEPPRNTVFFLLTPDRNLLLKTLLSRARVLRCEVLSEEAVKSALTERYPDKADSVERIMRLASGSLGEAVGLMENEALSEVIELVSRYFDEVSKGAGFYKLSTVLSPTKPVTREQLSDIISYFAIALRDIALLYAEEEPRLMFFTDRSVPDKIVTRRTLREIVSSFELCERLIQRTVSANVGTAIALLNSSLASDMK